MSNELIATLHCIFCNTNNKYSYILMNMDLIQLKQFLALCDTLNFRTASDRVHTSPSTLSRSIQRMEEETGCALFDRDNREVRLTRNGALFRDWATSVLDSYKRFQFKVLEEHTVLRGELSIFGSVTAYYSVMSPIIEAFRNAYPEVHLKLQTGSPADAHQKVSSNEVDLGITMMQEGFKESVLFLPITTTPLVFIASRGSQAEEAQNAITALPMVLPSKGLGRERVDAWFRAQGVAPDIYAQVEGNEAILAMVSLGCGIGLVPKLVLEKSPLKEHIRILDITPELEPYLVGLIVQKKRLKNPMVKAFWELVETAFAQNENIPFG